MSNQRRRPQRVPAPALPDAPNEDIGSEDVEPVVMDATEIAGEPTQLHPEPVPPNPDPVETPPEPVFKAKITADEVIVIRRLDQSIDHLTEQIKFAEESIARQKREVDHMKVARDGTTQHALVQVRELLRKYNMTPGPMYRVNVETAEIVPVMEQ